MFAILEIVDCIDDAFDLVLVIIVMQKRAKPSKKKTEKSSVLTRSLSARISPLAITQKFLPGSFDLETVIKKKFHENHLNVGHRKFSFLTKSKSGHGINQLKYTKLGKQHSEKTIIKKDSRNERMEFEPNDKIYLNELRMKIKEIKMQNRIYEKQVNSASGGNSKVWTAVESFVKQLKNKLSIMS